MIMIVISFALVKFYAFAILYVLIVMQIKVVVVLKKCIQTLWDRQKKFLLLKTTKNARFVRSLGKIPHFGAYPEAKKGVARGQVP